MTKKRKGQDADGEDDGEQCRTPIRSELDKLESKLFPFLLIACSYISWYPLILFAEKEQTPLQEALNQLIRQLQRCRFFIWLFRKWTDE